MGKNWLQLFSLRENADYEGTVTSISEGVSLRGYNLWLLLCSSMLASIGLDTNSAAIIIGAMLISPLMSPILGVGLSIAIHDKQLLLRSGRNLSVAVVISLLGSVLYFLITPLGIPTEQLQARTYPTLLDVLVAFFGGLAGIVSISRLGPTNAIPGVAIATALMPPLCTAGFGIATARWDFFFGAFYLFFINAIFISMATYLVVKYLHFPERRFRSKRLQRSYSFWFGLLSFIAVLPSIYFLYSLYQKEMIRERIDSLVLARIKDSGNEILKWEMVPRDSVINIKIFHSGISIPDSFRHIMDSALQANGLSNYKVNTFRVNLTREEVSNMSAEITRQMFNEMLVRQITAEPARDSLDFSEIWREARVFLPSIDSASNGWILMRNSSSEVDTIPAFFYYAATPLRTEQQSQLYNYLKIKYKTDTVSIFYNPRS